MGPMITAFVVAMTLNGATAFTPARDYSEPNVYLEGTFQSCPDDEDGSYGERIYSQAWHGVTLWELHLGPRDEFALFAGQPAAEHESHESPRNKLQPAFHYSDVETLRGGRNWLLPTLNLHLNVVKVQGSHDECYSFLLRVERDRPLRSVAR